MKRPEFITNDDILRWIENIKNDPWIVTQPLLINNELIIEVAMAGLWLAEELTKLNCPPDIIFRIQYTAGQYSFGKDIWEVHQDILQQFKDNTLIFPENVTNN